MSKDMGVMNPPEPIEQSVSPDEPALQTNPYSVAYMRSLIESLIRRDSGFSDEELEDIAQGCEIVCTREPNDALAILSARKLLKADAALQQAENVGLPQPPEKQVDETVSPDEPALQTGSDREAEVKWDTMDEEILTKLKWLTEQGVEWGATSALKDEEHIEQFRRTLQITHEHFETTEPRELHGVYLKGTETVICHAGTSPNSPIFARIIAGLIMSALRVQERLFAAERELSLKSVEDATPSAPQQCISDLLGILDGPRARSFLEEKKSSVSCNFPDSADRSVSPSALQSGEGE